MKRSFTGRHLTNVAAIRSTLGYTQNYLAKLLGIPRSSLSMIEAGKRPMPTDAFVKMANMEIERHAQNDAAKNELNPEAAYSYLVMLEKPDCLALISKVSNEQAYFEWKKNTLGWQRTSLIVKAQSIDTKLAELNKELPDLELMATLLPEGQVKDETTWKLRGLQQQQLVLVEQRRNTMLSIFKKQREASGLESGITDAKDFIQAITNRMNAIAG